MPICPFCGVKLGPLESFIIKNKGLYKCRMCGKVSEVSLKQSLYNLLCLIQILSVSIFIISVFQGGSIYLVGLGLILIIFGGFYWATIHMIKLKKPRYIKKRIPWYRNLFNKKKRKSSTVENKSDKDFNKHDNNYDNTKDIYSN